MAGGGRNSSKRPPAWPASPAHVASSQKASQAQTSTIDRTTPKPQSANEKLQVNTCDTSATTHDAPDAQGAGAEEPQLPITPKSPLPALHDTNEKVSPPRNAAVQQDMTAVDELLITMKRMLGTLGSTFDMLGNQTIKVATLPIAIDAMHQITSLKHDFEEQQHRQDAKMDDLKTMLLDQVKAHLYTGLKETASAIVKEVISKLVANRVRSQLQSLISQSVRDDAIACKAQITEARIRLLNSEARRHNALIRQNSLTEPLRALYRPAQYIMSPATAGPKERASGASASLPNIRTSTSQSGQASLVIQIDGRPSGGFESPMSALDVEHPTPSPLFPRDLASLARLQPEEAKALVFDYGLGVTRVREPLPATTGSTSGKGVVKPSKTAPAKTANRAIEESKEEVLNKFLSYIGVVGFQLVPTTPIQGVSNSPLVTRAVE